MNKESFAACLENLYIVIFLFGFCFTVLINIYAKILLTSVLKARYSTYKTESALEVSRVLKPYKVSDSSFENLKIRFNPTPSLHRSKHRYCTICSAFTVTVRYNDSVVGCL